MTGQLFLFVILMAFFAFPIVAHLLCKIDRYGWENPCAPDMNATIVGTKTYGKGVIQQILSLRSGAGVKVTVEEYYTPNRTKINKIGIEPDEKIELPKSVTNPLLVEEKDDTQLQKAIELLK